MFSVYFKDNSPRLRDTFDDVTSSQSLPVDTGILFNLLLADKYIINQSHHKYKARNHSG